jgi:hypothetical protein
VIFVRRKKCPAFNGAVYEGRLAPPPHTTLKNMNTLITGFHRYKIFEVGRS